jgi:site-specific DNA-methyltransferase (adenine-specific)
MEEGIVVADACEWLSELPAGILDAVITSPPYLDARSEYPHFSDPDSYAAWTAQWAEAALDAVAKTGSLFLNLGLLWRDKRIVPYHLQALSACMSVGWVWVQEITWYKPNANPLQGAHITSAHEPVYWLAHNADLVYSSADDIRREYAPGTAARYERGWINSPSVKGSPANGRGRTLNPTGARAQNVLVHTSGKEKGNPHPCPMPLDLARELVLLACPAGGLVGTPFAGSGTVGVACAQTGRRWCGCDIDPPYVELTRQRLAHQIVEGDDE